ncbi:type II secretion system F family protein [Planctomycetales bacterium ZRK34]|nr:type II secretion system F family protein [Planctomycetales bacterium ZRK34]
MPSYQFEALDQTGKPQKGTVDAPNSEEAINRIKGQGFFPTSVREKKVRKRKGGAAAEKAEKAEKAAGGKKKKTEITITIGGVSKKILTQFTRQLSTLQDAGLPILRSLQILTDQQKPGKLKNTLYDVQNEVEGGSSLSEAMAKHPKVFDRLYSKMIAAGEVGGVLDIILQRLADFMEKAQRLKRKIIGAMIYPSVVITVAVLIIIAIMVLVVPKFQEIFEDFDTELPAPTQFLINTSNWIAGKDTLIPGWAVIICTPIIIIMIAKLLRKTKAGRAALDMGQMRIPVVGNLIRLSAVARFTRTLGTLISAGVPILEAILIARDTVGNWVFEQALQKVHDSIREGESFAAPLREARVCDSIVVNMIDVGEETGDLDKMLIKIADNYDDEVDTAVGALISLLEPLMVVLLGGSVGFIVIALFLPLVKLIQSVTG